MAEVVAWVGLEERREANSKTTLHGDSNAQVLGDLQPVANVWEVCSATLFLRLLAYFLDTTRVTVLLLRKTLPSLYQAKAP